ncbi:hypothetical protein BH11PLA1_BH11PLA1_13440 [soil metagenome]
MTRRRVALVLGAFLLLGGGAVFAALWAARQRPAWYVPVDAAAPAVRTKAQDVENGVTTLLNAAQHEPLAHVSMQPSRPPGTFVMRIKAADANAWLAARLRPWAEHEYGEGAYPARLRSVLVNFVAGSIVIGAEIADGVGAAAPSRFVTLRFTPEVDAQGRLWLRAASAAIGFVPVPLSMMADRLSGGNADARAEIAALAAAVKGERAVGPAHFPRADGKRVVVDSIELGDGTMTLLCRTAERTAVLAPTVPDAYLSRDPPKPPAP